ncbi:MAG: DUF6065 family protein [Betaproteobacteria bacterium]
MTPFPRQNRIRPLAGVIETDWRLNPFTMNWQMTRPGKLRFDRDLPVDRRGEKVDPAT